jgi:hypothetical protein
MQKVRLDLNSWSELYVHNRLFNANFYAKLKKKTPVILFVPLNIETDFAGTFTDRYFVKMEF